VGKGLVASLKILITLARYRRRWQDNIKMHLKVKSKKYELDSFNKIPSPKNSATDNIYHYAILLEFLQESDTEAHHKSML
jgi:hypothetical protein